MPGLTLVRPLSEAAVITGNGAPRTNLLTPSPAEVWVATSLSSTIFLDLGAERTLDSIYIGATNAAPDTQWRLHILDGPAGAIVSTPVPQRVLPLTGATGVRQSAFLRTAVPFTARYLSIVFTKAADPKLQVGNLVLGLAMELPYAMGAGRTPVDLSRRLSMISGGFGIEPGAMKSAFSFSLVDLDDATFEAIWAIVIDRGTVRPLVLVEGYSSASPIAPQVHYCTFEKFERPERESQAATRWSLSVEDWV